MEKLIVNSSTPEVNFIPESFHNAGRAEKLLNKDLSGLTTQAQIVLVNSSKNDQLKVISVNSCATDSTTDAELSALCGDATAHGRTFDKALDIWRQHGAPIIYLNQGINCLDLGNSFRQSGCFDGKLKDN
jgi:hypothetical protein